MSWDWEKLKEQQQHQRPGGGSGGPGNIPPQVDDLVKQFKNMKIPGGPLIALAVVLILFIGYSIFFYHRIRVGGCGPAVWKIHPYRATRA